jgi:hypothetical protein
MDHLTHHACPTACVSSPRPCRRCGPCRWGAGWTPGAGTRSARGRVLALSRAPAVQGHRRAERPGHRRGLRRRGGPVQRLHLQGVHLLLGAAARRGPRDGHAPAGRDDAASGAFRPEEIASEAHVVLEEINMNEDDPLTWPTTSSPGPCGGSTCWPVRYSAPVSRSPPWGATSSPATGRAGITRRRWWSPPPGTPSTTTWFAWSRIVSADGRVTAGHELAPPAIEPRVGVVRRDTEQAHLVIGGEGLDRSDDRRFAFGLLNHVLGGGMSSRLFREIREERGLAYAVYAFRMPYADSGAFGVYVGTTPTRPAGSRTGSCRASKVVDGASPPRN